MSRRNPNKADISRDLRVADAPNKHPEQVKFEEDLAYIKEISIPKAERKGKPAKMRRSDEEEGPIILGVLATICLLGFAMFLVFTAYDSSLATDHFHQKSKQRGAAYALCVHRNTNAQITRNVMQAALHQRTQELGHTTGPRKLQLERAIDGYRRGIDSVQIIDCNKAIG